MGFIYAFLSAFLFAANNVLIKKGMKYSENDNGLLISITTNLFVVGIALIIYRFSVAEPIPPTPMGILIFAAAGLLTTLIGRFTLFSGIRRIGSSRAVTVKNTAPLFTIIFAIFFLNETISLGPWIGIAFILAGLFYQVYLMFLARKESANISGLLFALCSAIVFGMGHGVRKQGMELFADPIAGAFTGLVVAFISFFIMERVRSDSWKQTIQHHFMIKNVYYVLGGLMSSIALICFFLAIQTTNVAYIGPIVAVEPIVTIILSRIFLSQEESLSLSVWIIAGMIVLGAGIIAITG